MINKTPLRQKGFTIVELLIATAVLSTILLLVTIMMTSIGNLYFKGINQARVQDATRTVTDDLSQHLQLSGQTPTQPPSPPPPGLQTTLAASGVRAYCIGTTRYTFVLYKKIGGSPGSPDFQSPHVLWRDTLSASGSCLMANLNATDPSQGTDIGGLNAKDGTELIAPNSRLTDFSISPLASPYTVSVGMAYGDNDLLCDTGVPGNCAAGNLGSLIGNPAYTKVKDILCKGRIGDRFCSTASLSTTAVQRLTGN